VVCCGNGIILLLFYASAMAFSQLREARGAHENLNVYNNNHHRRTVLIQPRSGVSRPIIKNCSSVQSSSLPVDRAKRQHPPSPTPSTSHALFQINKSMRSPPPLPSSSRTITQDRIDLRPAHQRVLLESVQH